MVFLLEEVHAQPDLEDIPRTLRNFANETEMEKAYNVVELPILFAARPVTDDEAWDQSLRELAKVLAFTWHAKLDRDFPGRLFVVEILEGDIDDPAIRFYSIR
jgi:hypothetical protein